MARPKRNASIKTSSRRDSDLVKNEVHKNGNGVLSKRSPSDSIPTDLTIPPIKISLNSETGLSFNWQATPKKSDYFSQMLDLTGAYVDTNLQTLFCPQMKGSFSTNYGVFTLATGDAIYLVCEPPGEPYYIGKIKRFVINKEKDKVLQEQDNSKNAAHIVPAKNCSFLMHWFYRPKDISKATHDLRLLYSSMHTDKCPIMSYRGRVKLMLKSDIEPQLNMTLDEYTSHPDHFYFDMLFDRYMLKFYDVILTDSLLSYAELPDNHSLNFIKCLHKRFEYIFVEPSRVKTLLNGLSDNTCHCDICGQWCSAVDSVSCGTCLQHYHMLCLDPPLMTMPKKGFTWSCGTCAKNDDMAFENKRIVMLETNKATNEASLRSLRRSLERDPESAHLLQSESTAASSPSSMDSSTIVDETSYSSANSSPDKVHLPKYEVMASKFLAKDKLLTLEQRRLQEEWTIRYLGIYARLEDAVDIHDRNPYPRASTRLGYKHQAVYLPEYEDHPIQYYDCDENADNSNRRKGWGGRRRSIKRRASFQGARLPIPKEFDDVDPKDYPQWLQPRPKGYVERGLDEGEDITSTLMWKPVSQEEEAKLAQYLETCAPKALELGILATSPNFMDFILKAYLDTEGDTAKALARVSTLNRQVLREPTFSQEEIDRFEKGVLKYGSELHPTYTEVGTQDLSMIVRFYYLWKKTENGRRIWGNFKGRKKNKLHPKAKEPSDIILEDKDYNIEQIHTSSENIRCKHCSTNHSVQWYCVTDTEIPDSGASDKDKEREIVGLCIRCARLWRKYGVVWEDPITLKKKMQLQIQKRKYEYELMQDVIGIVESSYKQGGLIPPKKQSADLSSESTPVPTPSKKARTVKKKAGDDKTPTSTPVKRGRPFKKKTEDNSSMAQTPAKLKTVKRNGKKEENGTNGEVIINGIKRESSEQDNEVSDGNAIGKRRKRSDPRIGENAVTV